MTRTVALLTLALAAAADETRPLHESGGGTYVLDKFVTTGSTIRRTDTEKALPVTLLSLPQIEARDATTPLDLLTGIPQVTTIPANETPTNAVASRGGNAAAALRGIGAENTLILFNGRRVPFNPISILPPTSTVNINTLPAVGLSHLEILRDGASAVYGADAVAGVINFIAPNQREGGAASVRYGVTEHGGGMDVLGTFTFGRSFHRGRGRWVGTLGLYHRDAIHLRERAISASAARLNRARPPWNVEGSIYDGRTPVTALPSFRLGTDAATGTVWNLNRVDGIPTLTTAARPRSDYEDYNQYVVGQPMAWRGNLFGRFDYDLSAGMTVFVEALGYLSESRTGRQPITLNSSDARVTLSIDNPYNPFGSAFYGPGKLTASDRPTAITIASKLIDEGGNETIEASDRMHRLLVGLKGQFGQEWNWEAAVMQGGYRITDDPVNSIRESLLKQAALRTGPDAWNPFGYTFKVENGTVVADRPYVNPPEVQQFYTTHAERIGHSRLASADAHLTGSLVELWAGPLAVAAGAEWRYEYKSDYKPPYVSVNPPNDPTVDSGNNDILVMSPKYNYDASRTVASVYAEAILPLLGRKNEIPFATSLELTASIRRERYSDFGNSTNPKAGLNWKPVPGMILRGSYNRGFRAPDLTSLNQPASFNVATPPGNRDPVRNNYFLGAGQAADPQVLTRTYTLPNPELGPEKSQGATTGAVFEVPGAKGLSIAIDYWEIEQSHLIFSQARDAAADAALLLAYTQQQLAAGKNILQIDVGSRPAPDGTHTYVGDPYTLRAPVTADDLARFQATYAVLPQHQWIAPTGVWLGTTSREVNGTGKAFTNGIDYEVDYTLPRTPLGEWRVTSTWSQFLNKFRKDTPTDPKNDDIKSMLIPEWRSSTTLQWRQQSWGASLNATYSSAIRTNAQTNLAGYTSAGSPDYIRVVTNDGATYYYEEGSSTLQLNLGVSYRFRHEAQHWLRGVTLRLGVNNVLDEEPPLIVANDAGTGVNTPGYSGVNGTSLWVGRAYSLTLSRDF